MGRRFFSKEQDRHETRAPIDDPDAPLVAAALSDRDAFTPLFDRYWESIFKFAYAQLGDWHVAEDAASDVFLRAIANLENFDPAIPGTTFRSWLFGIARHVTGSSYRTSLRRPQTPLESVPDIASSHDSLEDDVIAAEQHETLRRLLDELPANQRQLLELRMAGLSAVEIGRVLGRSQESIRKAQSRSVISLRDALHRQTQTTIGQDHG